MDVVVTVVCMAVRIIVWDVGIAAVGNVGHAVNILVVILCSDVRRRPVLVALCGISVVYLSG